MHREEYLQGMGSKLHFIDPSMASPAQKPKKEQPKDFPPSYQLSFNFTSKTEKDNGKQLALFF